MIAWTEVPHRGRIWVDKVMEVRHEAVACVFVQESWE